MKSKTNKNVLLYFVVATFFMIFGALLTIKLINQRTTDLLQVQGVKKTNFLKKVN